MTPPPGVRLSSDLEAADWVSLRGHLAHDGLDNGRTPEELARSFGNSAHAVLAVTSVGGVVVGTGRLLSDGVRNAYLVDLWTRSHWRRTGVATAIVHELLSRIPGQHVALLNAEMSPFYARLGFEPEAEAVAQVVGRAGTR